MNNYARKGHQKWTALLVLVTFAWLLNVSAMPQAAADASEQAAVVSAGQETGCIEQEGPAWTYARSKSYTRVIVSIVIVIAVYALIMGLTHCCGSD